MRFKWLRRMLGVNRLERRIDEISGSFEKLAQLWKDQGRFLDALLDEKARGNEQVTLDLGKDLAHFKKFKGEWHVARAPKGLDCGWEDEEFCIA